jgi:hypothetical protein
LPRAQKALKTISFRKMSTSTLSARALAPAAARPLLARRLAPPASPRAPLLPTALPWRAAAPRVTAHASSARGGSALPADTVASSTLSVTVRRCCCCARLSTRSAAACPAC